MTLSGKERPASAIYRFIIKPHSEQNPRAIACLSDARALGFLSLEAIFCHDLVFVEGELSDVEVRQLASQLLIDPLVQTVDWSPFQNSTFAPDSPPESGCRLIEVALRPGVTDPVAEQVVRAAGELGIEGVYRASTAMRYWVRGAHDDAMLDHLAQRLLANPTIQGYTLGAIEPNFPQAAEASSVVETISVREMDEQNLLSLSQERRAALDLAEMRAVQRYFQSQHRDMTDIEFETIAQTWSEHCVHKTFRAEVEVKEANGNAMRINNLLKTYLRAATDQINAPWVRSAFVDNAGIIDFDGEYEVSFKVETHNHPSAIEPFGGANTGIGGVIRDVIGVSAKPIAATDVLCFGPVDTPLDNLPQGVLHPLRVRSGVVGGVQDYGNKIGLPTVSGAILYDPGFTANPLVFCGCVGLAPKNSHPSQPLPGDRVIVLGGRTGRDGLRGATFSSMTMDAKTGEVAGASVQIGAPIVEKGLIDVILQARDERLYHAITDCGAGGLSSAVGEMANPSGADLDLKDVRLKYPGLAPWEIWLSEAQERMVLAVSTDCLPRLQALCNTYEVELTDIGHFSGDGWLVVRYCGALVLRLENQFLHDGLPQRQLTALLPVELEDEAANFIPPAVDVTQALLKLLAHPNIASKESVIRLYDHEVQGGTVVKPLTGAANDGPSDAAVLKPIGTQGSAGIVLSAGINPEYGKYAPGRMTYSVIDEAIRNAVAVGADPRRIALLDNFCWGDPRNPETMGTLVESLRACYEGAVFYSAPFISGKDSLNNEYIGTDGQRHAIPPTLLISAIGIIPDINRAVTMDLKAPGSRLYLAGSFLPRLGGSHLALLYGAMPGPAVPDLPMDAPELYQCLYETMQQGLVLACHDLSEGGLAVAAAEMCIGGRLGLNLDLTGIVDPSTIVETQPWLPLFGETNGCLLVEVAEANVVDFENAFGALPLRQIGQVTTDPRLVISASGETRVNARLEKLVAAWKMEKDQEQKP